MDVSSSCMRQIVYEPVEFPSSVSKSVLKSLSRLWSLAYASRLNKWALGRGVCIYTYPGGTPSISNTWAPSLSPVGTGGISFGCVALSGVGVLSYTDIGALVPLHFQRVRGLCAVPVGQGRKTSVPFCRSIVGCLSIAALIFLCPGNSTPCLFSSWTSARVLLIRNFISPITACENPSLAILAIFKARHMSDCSSCTGPPCLAIVADMLNTYYKKLFAASTYQIWLLPLSYTLA